MAKAEKKIEAKDQNKQEKVVANKNAPIYSFNIKIKEGDAEKTYRIELKKPTRTMTSDADMFYSIQLSKYIKMGLLTAEQLAKRQIDVGGTFSEEQQKQFAALQATLAEKQEMFLRLMSQKELNEDEHDRKSRLVADIALIRTQIMDYEYVRGQVYEHTANIKARNDVIMWWVLSLARFGEIVEGKEVEMAQMFPGESHEVRKLKLEEMEDSESKILEESFIKMARAITMWYWMGVSDRDKLEELMEEESRV